MSPQRSSRDFPCFLFSSFERLQHRNIQWLHKALKEHYTSRVSGPGTRAPDAAAVAREMRHTPWPCVSAPLRNISNVDGGTAPAARNTSLGGGGGGGGKHDDWRPCAYSPPLSGDERKPPPKRRSSRAANAFAA